MCFGLFFEDSIRDALYSNCYCIARHLARSLESDTPNFGGRLRSSQILSSRHPRDSKILGQKLLRVSFLDLSARLTQHELSWYDHFETRYPIPGFNILRQRYLAQTWMEYDSKHLNGKLWVSSMRVEQVCTRKIILQTLQPIYFEYIPFNLFK